MADPEAALAQVAVSSVGGSFYRRDTRKALTRASERSECARERSVGGKSGGQHAARSPGPRVSSTAGPQDATDRHSAFLRDASTQPARPEMTLAAVVVVITVVTLGVGALGAGRIGKYRPALKSYDPAKSSDMGSSRDARMRLKTDSETASDPRGESHVRARLEIGDHEPDVLAMLKRVCWMLFQLTGIPLLTGLGASTETTTSIMGNTAKPSLAVHELSHGNNNVEVDPLRDSKAPITAAAQQQELEDEEPQWSDESDSESDASSSAVSEQEIEDKATALRSEIMLDGLQFYTAVAKLSVSTAHNVIDIGLFRATTIVMRERRKAMEDASILAIEESYPDIMCLPRFTSPSTKKLDVSEMEDMSRTRITSPRAQVQLETGFLKAA